MHTSLVNPRPDTKVVTTSKECRGLRNNTETGKRKVGWQQRLSKLHASWEYYRSPTLSRYTEPGPGVEPIASECQRVRHNKTKYNWSYPRDVYKKGRSRYSPEDGDISR